MATLAQYFDADAPEGKTGAATIEHIRDFLKAISDTQREFHPSDIHRLAYDRRGQLGGLVFKYGAVQPYSEDLDDVLSILLIKGDLELKSSDTCKIIIPESFRGQARIAM